ncbi:MAG TPA: NADP-dependent phosphogluconate dehydrogenase [Verrucomicrobiae bacterium]|jgi:6-phosphogluconate dehydrogenase|nr:NADP-dependent phosphogluconate dehydrogenase [Verrucomicrobiae bacterium]
MKIAIQGLGRMGMQIARKLSENDHSVIAHNRSPEPIEEAVSYGASAAHSKAEVLEAFGQERVVLWIMLPANIVDQQVDEWLELLPQDSIIIDGGNSDFRLTQKLNDKVAGKGCKLIDVGTSGGVWGYQNGFSMMVGADDAQAFAALEPALQTLAQPEGAYYHFGPSGSGHYVKMVHNAIEYGMMESLAEGYRMLKEGPYDDLDLAAAGNVWQHHSVVTSWLNELSQAALAENPQLDGIKGYVAESGEARWTLETAKQRNIPMPSIQAAFDVRLASQKGEVNFATKLLAAMRNKFGGHQLNQ